MLLRDVGHAVNQRSAFHRGALAVRALAIVSRPNRTGKTKFRSFKATPPMRDMLSASFVQFGHVDQDPTLDEVSIAIEIR
jgi:hypothetical protein